VRAALGVDGGTPEAGAGAEEPAVPVVTAPVEIAADDVLVRAVGTGRALRSVDLIPETQGKVAEIAIAAGRRFEEGEVLLRLDDTDQRLALALAEARLADARRTFERQEALRERGTVSETALTDAATAREIARIERDRAEAALADRTLRAPFDGTAGIPEVEVGDWVDTGTVIAGFDDRSRLLVEIDLPERWLFRVAPGMAAEVRPPGTSAEPLEGEIAAIDSRVDPVTRTARLRVGLDNAEDRLRPGASFRVTLRLPGERHPRVPELAYQHAREGGYVWRVADGRAERVPVSIVRRRSGEVLVEGALAAGDRVVVEGVQRLRPGRRVRTGKDAAGALAARD
jgi:RND family efflux transporter MFP subunit